MDHFSEANIFPKSFVRRIPSSSSYVIPKEHSKSANSTSDVRRVWKSSLIGLQTALLCLVGAIMLSTSDGAPVGCKSRSVSTLQATLRNHSAYMVSPPYPHYSYYSTPAGQPWISGSLKNSGNNVDGILTGTDVCESKPSNKVYESSICPWYYVMNTDPDRFPQNLAIGRTACTDGCIGVPGSKGACVPVKFNLPVLRRNGECDTDGFYQYHEEWQEVVTGFTCALIA